MESKYLTSTWVRFTLTYLAFLLFSSSDMSHHFVVLCSSFLLTFPHLFQRNLRIYISFTKTNLFFPDRKEVNQAFMQCSFSFVGMNRIIDWWFILCCFSSYSKMHAVRGLYSLFSPYAVIWERNMFTYWVLCSAAIGWCSQWAKLFPFSEVHSRVPIWVLALMGGNFNERRNY